LLRAIESASKALTLKSVRREAKAVAAAVSAMDQKRTRSQAVAVHVVKHRGIPAQVPEDVKKKWAGRRGTTLPRTHSVKSWHSWELRSAGCCASLQSIC